MKTRTLFIIGLLVTGFFSLTAFKPAPAPTSLYEINKVSEGAYGTGYEWIWSIRNPNPGNGNDGTIQNLSHWTIAVSNTIEVSDIIGVAYSTDGVTWHALTPSIALDKSNPCSIGQTVMKFDYGTTGGEPTYYRLILDSQEYADPLAVSTVFFKSGSKTECYSTTISGPALSPTGTTR